MRRRFKHEKLDYDPLRYTVRYTDGTEFKYVQNALGRTVLDITVEHGGDVRRFVELPPSDYDEWRND